VQMLAISLRGRIRYFDVAWFWGFWPTPQAGIRKYLIPVRRTTDYVKGDEVQARQEPNWRPAVEGAFRPDPVRLYWPKESDTGAPYSSHSVLCP